MKLFKNLKKGFTLIELVVVIAVIAILSAVSVVSYVAITNKARTSSDEQAVAQMNTILKANEILDLKSLDALYAAFEESGLNAEDYIPLMKDRYFYWDTDANLIVYADENGEALYPESLKGNKKADSNWLSLSASTNEDSSWKESATKNGGKYETVAISSGEQMVSTLKSYKEKADDFAGATTLNLSGKVDMSGAGVSIKEMPAGSSLTLQGSGEESTTLKNFISTDYANMKYYEQYGGNVKYGSGMFLTIPAGTTVTLKDMTIKGTQIFQKDPSSASSRMVGVVAGQVFGTLRLENVTIEDAYLTGYQKIGGFVGCVQASGVLEMTNCTIRNSTIETTCTDACGIVGAFDSKADMSKQIFNNVVVDNSCKIECNIGQAEIDDGAHSIMLSSDNEYVVYSDLACTVDTGKKVKLYAGKYTYYNDYPKLGAKGIWATQTKFYTVNTKGNTFIKIEGEIYYTAFALICNSL